MAERSRVPSEAEARLLLRELARRMEDEAAVGEAATLRRRGRPGVVAVASGLRALCIAALPYMGDDKVPFTVWAPLAMLALMCAQQAVQIAWLSRTTAALARIAERTRRGDPLPRAPSLPATGATGSPT